MKVWLRKHGVTPSEVPSYISDTRHLLHKASLKSYEVTLDECKKKWSKAFLDYFMSNIHPEVCHSVSVFNYEVCFTFNRYLSH